MREDKSKITHSPPPGASPPRKGLGKQSKTGRRDVAEKDKAELRRNHEDIAACCSKTLIKLLTDGGVSEPYLVGLQNDFAMEVRDDDIQHLSSEVNYLVRVDNALEKVWSFASCYPSM